MFDCGGLGLGSLGNSSYVGLSPFGGHHSVLEIVVFDVGVVEVEEGEVLVLVIAIEFAHVQKIFPQEQTRGLGRENDVVNSLLILHGYAPQFDHLINLKLGSNLQFQLKFCLVQIY